MSVIGGKEKKKKKKDTWESDVVPRDVPGSSLGSAPILLSSLGLGFTPPPASPQHQEPISSVKKRKTKQKPHYQNKGVGFVSENVTLRNPTEDPNPFQAS